MVFQVDENIRSFHGEHVPGYRKVAPLMLISEDIASLEPLVTPWSVPGASIPAFLALLIRYIETLSM